jgi:hypothetical protein
MPCETSEEESSGLEGFAAAEGESPAEGGVAQAGERAVAPATEDKAARVSAFLSAFEGFFTGI